MVNLADILTLRHDPSNKTHTFRRLTAQDFNNEVDFNSKHLEVLISHEIRKILKQYRPRSVAVPLSGGVDSTLIAKLVKEVKPDDCKLYLVSMGFGHESDEVKEAESIAEEIGSNTFEQIMVPNVLHDLPKHIRIVKEPRWNTYFGYVVEYVRNVCNTKVIITGDGGDELFGGYSFRYSKFLEQTKGINWSFKRALAYLESGYSRDFVEDQEDLFGKKVKFSWDRIIANFRQYFEYKIDPMNQYFVADFNSKLVHDYVPTNTALYNYFDVKGFTPMLTNSIIDYACSIDPAEKYNKESGMGKLPLRSILVSKGLNKFMLPQKTGYGTDLLHLWKNVGKHEASILMGKPLIVTKELINPKWIEKHLVTEQKDVRVINKLFQLVALEYWLRK